MLWKFFICFSRYAYKSSRTPLLKLKLHRNNLYCLTISCFLNWRHKLYVLSGSHKSRGEKEKLSVILEWTDQWIQKFDGLVLLSIEREQRIFDCTKKEKIIVSMSLDFFFFFFAKLRKSWSLFIIFKWSQLVMVFSPSLDNVVETRYSNWIKRSTFWWLVINFEVIYHLDLVSFCKQTQ